MPTYEYRCKTCGIEFEFFQHMNEAPLALCPKEECPLDEEKKGSGMVERRISAGTGLVFKGSGFYITDYKKTSVSPQSPAPPAKKDDSGAPATTPAPNSEPAAKPPTKNSTGE